MEKQNYVNPGRFSATMEDVWTKSLKNVPNIQLMDTWFSIAECYKNLIQNHDVDNQGERKQLTYVLSPPTGSGKTIGTIIYCALLSRES